MDIEPRDHVLRTARKVASFDREKDAKRVDHPEIFDNVGFVLNEGGGGGSEDDNVVFGVEVTQKLPVWLRLNAIDTPGHGSSPRPNSSVTRIVRALNTLLENPFPPRIIGPVADYFSALSVDMAAEWGPAYGNIVEAIQDPDFVTKLHEYRAGHHSLIRDTCSMTRMSGSSKINVIPPQAWAELDCRAVSCRINPPSNLLLNCKN
jgi:acetylornithine deacetylase/succinyl-diaminopimelate desuccinylase-like protein